MDESKELNETNFIQQVVEYGYFAEQIPNCFNSTLLLNKLNDILPLIKTEKNRNENFTTSPTTLSTYKDDRARRIISLPNPEAFLRLVKLMSENWSKIREFAKSSNSLSPITYILTDSNYGDLDFEMLNSEMLNSENLRDNKNIKSDFVEAIEKCIHVSLGYKYRLGVDIANCYNTIYTHSIAWAICGKAEVKKHRRKQGSLSSNPDYPLANKLDDFTRYQKNNETNGILVGPYTSRIFSEIILSKLDKKFCDSKYQFMRYIDDYKIYFRTELEAQASLANIEEILNEYALNLNTSKTQISKYPFEIISNMASILEKTLENGDVFDILNVAAQLQASGEKGAYKYALKLIKEKPIPQKKFDIIISTLINILLLNPKYGIYISTYLKENLASLTSDKIKQLMEIMNEELLNSLNNKLEQESLFFIYIIRELNLNLKAENLVSVLKNGDDFSIIIALDIWKNRTNTVISDNTDTATMINKNIEEWAINLKDEDMNGDRWLLLYEISMHDLIPEFIFPKKIFTSFFKKLEEQNVSFYTSIKETRAGNHG